MTKSAEPKPPRHLRSATKRWFADVVAEFALEPHHIKLLTLAAEAWDRSCQAREVIDRDGLTFLDRFGQPKLRPEANVERDSRIGFARLLRELDLDVGEPASSTRLPSPPALPGNRRL